MAAATLLASLVLTVCRVFTPSERYLVLATAFVPFAVLGYALGVAGWSVVRRLGRGRRWLSTAALVVSVLGLLLHVALLAPSYAGSHATGRPGLTVLTANLRLGLGDTGEVTRIAESARADVVVLEEVTPPAFRSLSTLRHDLPYLGGEPFAGARGTVVLSRFPLSQERQVAVFNGAWLMQVAAPKPFSLLAVHTSEPMVTPVLWASDHLSLLWQAVLAARRGPVVIAGDFNATLDHRPIRDLMALGLNDAARQARSGWQPTWPSGSDAVYALPFGMGAMALDHVLTSREFPAISTETFGIARSDHRALLARLAVR